MEDHSGTIAVAGTSQEAATVNFDRAWIMMQNHSAASMWVAFGGAAVAGQPSIHVPAGSTWNPSFIDTRSINIICGTVGAAYTLKTA
jgi:hypothetical protein